MSLCLHVSVQGGMRLPHPVHHDMNAYEDDHARIFFSSSFRQPWLPLTSLTHAIIVRAACCSHVMGNSTLHWHMHMDRCPVLLNQRYLCGTNVCPKKVCRGHELSTTSRNRAVRQRLLEDVQHQSRRHGTAAGRPRARCPNDSRRRAGAPRPGPGTLRAPPPPQRPGTPPRRTPPSPAPPAPPGLPHAPGWQRTWLAAPLMHHPPV